MPQKPSKHDINPFKPDFTLCRNSRLVVDEDDLMWLKNKENSHALQTSFMEIFISKPLVVGKFNMFSGL